MDDVKGILQSKTVWSLLVGLTATLLLKAGYTVGDADQAAIVNYILQGVEVVSYLAGIVFRIKATKAIGA
ncbi:hypothetical protein EN866_19580 [Mesorhizobium sp. M2D.F.Ca.ET.223.01.1.1]|uniref:hypothetical protein n=1 Tax=unclassified Mesorhizobium TaxID=325217 RepID=UPI000FCA288E|nr:MULTISPECIES: hypothetical protein [unclassified Mesorhizobium]TGP89363.1 hypothetical protein EN864_19590 [bacterium M00.F.Ca.ET.221.01.1.1]TGP94736.1 hypothetical protein EN865_15460 [bacterium M00.F.Ca.ET.222.01.1.1]RVD58850.1 hypothetical protein EN783_14535 [Mesorhizobium sp. M2D.F.Ca.ET.140.01.1.1]TGP27878.1 hypothetical protein EN875_033015 [Mesorhizobium sp. M2D.F.Ca.ET.232.01.1.1]TGP75904.1 hypothetical protein EN867_15460 [Mesorhizobium sp. M2D.F.Ca.ET.224.01.1.1]